MYRIRIFKDPTLEFNSGEFISMLNTMQMCSTALCSIQQQILQKPFREHYGFVDIALQDSQVDDYLLLEKQLTNCGLDTYLIIGDTFV